MNTILESNGQNLVRKVEKSGKIKPFGHSRASKNETVPHFDHFSRPGEMEPYGIIAWKKNIKRCKTGILGQNMPFFAKKC